MRQLGGFEEHFSGARQMYEDQGFLAKLYLSAAVYFSDRVWLDYRQHADSCVAVVRREGRYEEVRGYFLRWFRDYLRKSPNPPRAVVRAVDRALLLNRHPWLRRVGRRLRRTVAAIKQA